MPATHSARINLRWSLHCRFLERHCLPATSFCFLSLSLGFKIPLCILNRQGSFPTGSASGLIASCFSSVPVLAVPSPTDAGCVKSTAGEAVAAAGHLFHPLLQGDPGSSSPQGCFPEPPRPVPPSCGEVSAASWLCRAVHQKHRDEY